MLKSVPLPPPDAMTPRARAFAHPDTIAAPLPAAELDRRWPLQPDALKALARKQTGLDDFGPGPLDEPLTQLCTSLREEVDLNAAGRENACQRLLNILVTRLRLQDLWQRHPEILDAPVERPIFIVGLPRSGTTYLHWLMARDPGLRHAPFWELLFPLPFGDAAAPPPQPDPRIAAARAALDRLHAAAPDMAHMHQLDAEEPEEELALMSLGFSSMAFEWSFAVPGFVDWYRRADHTEGYAVFRRVLQTLQWLRGGGQWVLKAPMHMENLDALLKVFPDAVLVQTHRDPVATTVSLSSLTCYGIRNYFDHPNPWLVGENIGAIIERLLRGICDFRRDGDPRFVDVHFHDLMRDPMAAIERIYAVAGRRMEPAAESTMRQWLASRGSQRSGRHDYAAEDFAIDLDERRRALAFYIDRFAVRVEGGGD